MPYGMEGGGANASATLGHLRRIQRRRYVPPPPFPVLKHTSLKRAGWSSQSPTPNLKPRPQSEAPPPIRTTPSLELYLLSREVKLAASRTATSLRLPVTTVTRSLGCPAALSEFLNWNDGHGARDSQQKGSCSWWVNFSLFQVCDRKEEAAANQSG